MGAYLRLGWARELARAQASCRWRGAGGQLELARGGKREKEADFLHTHSGEFEERRGNADNYCAQLSSARLGSLWLEGRDRFGEKSRRRSWARHRLTGRRADEEEEAAADGKCNETNGVDLSFV